MKWDTRTEEKNYAIRLTTVEDVFHLQPNDPRTKQGIGWDYDYLNLVSGYLNMAFPVSPYLDISTSDHI